MALRISNASGTFDLSKDFSTEIEDSSPIYNERGSQSIAATIPGTKNNFRLNGHIQRTDIDSAPVADERGRRRGVSSYRENEYRQYIRRRHYI